MITNSNRAYFANVLGCGLQEEVTTKSDSVYKVEYSISQFFSFSLYSSASMKSPVVTKIPHS